MLTHGLYFNDFSDAQDVFDNFHVDPHDREGVVILVADYQIDGYDGSAFVLFVRNSKLYEVNGGHCSCYGLEDQWNPEEVMLEELIKRTQYNRRLSAVEEALVEILDLIEIAGIERIGIAIQLMN